MEGPKVFVLGDPVETPWTFHGRNQGWLVLILSLVQAEVSPTFHEWDCVCVCVCIRLSTWTGTSNSSRSCTHMTLLLSRGQVPRPWISAVLLTCVDQQNSTEVKLCLKKSGSFHFHPFGTQEWCKEDWVRLLKNEKPRGEETFIHLFFKALRWFDFLEHVVFILEWKWNRCACEC